MEVNFSSSYCKFEISTQDHELNFSEGEKFQRIIDGATVSYALQENVTVPPWGIWVGILVSTVASGWHQLDHADHFRISPVHGVVVRNIEPSREDVQPTGRDFTQMQSSDGKPARVTFEKPL